MTYIANQDVLCLLAQPRASAILTLLKFVPWIEMVHLHFNTTSAKSVILYGSFNGSSSGLKMTKLKAGYYISLPSSIAAPFDFKFKVDENWEISNDYATRTDSSGNVNNTIADDNKVDSGINVFSSIGEEDDPTMVQSINFNLSNIKAKLTELASIKTEDPVSFFSEMQQIIGNHKLVKDFISQSVSNKSDKQSGGEKYTKYYLERYFSYDIPLSIDKHIGIQDWKYFKREDGNQEVYMIPLFKTDDSIIPIHVIHPYLFYECVNKWQKDRMTIKYHVDSCLSLPLHPTIQFIHTDWNNLNTVHDLYHDEVAKFKYVLVLDIANFYYSLYTHAICWLGIGRELSKLLRDIEKLWVNSIDSAIQSVQRSETSGIPNAGEFFENVASIAEIFIANEVELDIRKTLPSKQIKCLFGMNLFEFYCNSEDVLSQIEQLFIGILCTHRLNLNYSKRLMCETINYPKYNLVSDMHQYFRSSHQFDGTIKIFIKRSMEDCPFPFHLVFNWTIDYFKTDLINLESLLIFPYCVGKVLKILMSNSIDLTIQKRVLGCLIDQKQYWKYRTTTQLLWILAFIKHFNFPVQRDFPIFYNSVSQYSDYFVKLLLNLDVRDPSQPDWSDDTFVQLEKMIGMP